LWRSCLNRVHQPKHWPTFWVLLQRFCQSSLAPMSE
jgi:hypothetical protein